MRAIVLSAFLLSSLWADSQADVMEVFASMAAGISDNNPSEFLKALDKDMPGYGDLKTGIEALVNQAELASSVEPIKNEGDDSKRTVNLDWYLQIRSRFPDGPIVNRREVIHCELRKDGKHWKIVSLAAARILRPGEAGQSSPAIVGRPQLWHFSGALRFPRHVSVIPRSSDT